MKKRNIFISLLVISIAINIALLTAFRTEIPLALKELTTPAQTYENTILNAPGIETEYSAYCHFDTLSNVQIMTRDTAYTPLLPDKLIVPPGTYRIGKYIIDMRQEGLYKFVLSTRTAYQVIVFQKDILTLLSSVAWIQTHGASDDKYTAKEIMQIARYDKLCLTCKRISYYTRDVLISLGYKARIVATSTTKNGNGFDDGHIMLEVFIPDMKKWVLADLDNNMIFSDSNSGLLLSALEMQKALYSNQLTLKLLSKDITGDISKINTTDNGFTNFVLERLNTNDRLIAWYKKVCEVILIDNHFFNHQTIKSFTEADSVYNPI